MTKIHTVESFLNQEELSLLKLVAKSSLSDHEKMELELVVIPSVRDSIAAILKEHLPEKFPEQPWGNPRLTAEICSDLETRIDWSLFWDLEKILEKRRGRIMDVLENWPKKLVRSYFFNYAGEGKKQESYEMLIGFTKRQIRALEIRRNKIALMATLSGWENLQNLSPKNPAGFKAFISWLFGKEYDIEKAILTKAEVEDFFFNYAGKGKKGESYEALMKFTAKQISALEVRGSRIAALMTIMGWEGGKWLSTGTPSTFRVFVSWLFGVEYQLLDREAVEDFFFNYAWEGGKEESYNMLVKLTTKQISALEVHGNKIESISTLSGWENPEKLKITIPGGFKAFIDWLFGKEHTTEKTILTKDEIREFFFGYVREGKKDESYQKLMSLSQKDFNAIAIRGKKIKSIVKFSGWENPNKLRVEIQAGFRVFIAWLFGKERDITQKKTLDKSEIQAFFFSYAWEGKTKDESCQKLMSLDQKGINALELHGNKILSIVTYSGWGNPENLAVQTSDWFRAFIAWLFDKKYFLEKTAIDEASIKAFFFSYAWTGKTKDESYQKLMALTINDILSFEIRGHKIRSIARLSNWKNPDNLNVANPNEFKIFVSWVFGRKYERSEQSEIRHTFPAEWEFTDVLADAYWVEWAGDARIYDLDENGECFIGSEIWTSVTQKASTFSIVGRKVLEVLMSQSEAWLEINHGGRVGRKSWRSWPHILKLYRKSALMSLLPKIRKPCRLDKSWECMIEGEIWTSITQRTSGFSVGGQKLLKILESQSEEWLEANHGGRMGLNWPHTLLLYRKSAIEALLPKKPDNLLELNSAGECEIAWEIWMSLRKNGTYYWMSQPTLQGLIDRQPLDWHELNHSGNHWRSGVHNVKLYRKSAIEVLAWDRAKAIVLDDEGECLIDWETWVRVSLKCWNFRVSGKIVMGIIEKQSMEWIGSNHGGKMGTHWWQTVKLYRKSAIEKLLPYQLNASWECEIEWETWTMAKSSNRKQWERNIHQINSQSPEWHRLHGWFSGKSWVQTVPIYRKAAVLELLKESR